MTTQRQVEANQRNSLRSTGPTSEVGKDKSRRNAVKHGLLAKIVLPEDHQEKFQARLIGWKAAVVVDNELLEFQLEQAVHASIKIQSCQSEEVLRKVELVDIAMDTGPDWDLNRQEEANQLGDSLKRNPTRVALELKRTPAGRRWLIARWEMLVKVLPGVEGHYLWDESHTHQALDLLGTPARDLATMPTFRDSFLNPDTVRTLIEAEMGVLQELQTNAATENASLRELHCHGLRLENDRILKRLHRYEALAQRMFQRSLEAVQKPKTQVSQTSAADLLPAFTPQPVLAEALGEPQPWADQLLIATPLVEDPADHLLALDASVEAQTLLDTQELNKAESDCPELADDSESLDPTNPVPTLEVDAIPEVQETEVPTEKVVVLTQRQLRKLRNAGKFARYLASAGP